LAIEDSTLSKREGASLKKNGSFKESEKGPELGFQTFMRLPGVKGAKTGRGGKHTKNIKGTKM